jgi:CheY-like chemotaxis protein
VVDDDRDVRELAVACLETLGYHAVAVEGGRAAVEVVKKDLHIDMMLVDVAMPEMNGVETVTEILKRRPSTPFLYMTGYIGPTKLDPAEDRVLKKPFTIAELARKIEETLFPVEDNRGSNVVPIKPATRSH